MATNQLTSNQFTDNDSILIVGSGHSAAHPKAAYLKEKQTKIFRINWFFLEHKLNFGQQVDYYYFNFAEILLTHLVLKIKKHYFIKHIFSSPGTFISGTSIFQLKKIYHRYLGCDIFQALSKTHCATVSPLLTTYPLENQIREITALYQKVPTSGVYALLKSVTMGFRDIRIVGMDFYTGNNGVYGQHSLPQHLEKYYSPILRISLYNKLRSSLGIPLLAKTVTGYPSPKRPSIAHAVEFDIKVIRCIISHYPDIRLSVFCSDQAVALWQQIEGIHIFTAKDIPETSPPLPNRFISALDDITLNPHHKNTITRWVTKMILHQYLIISSNLIKSVLYKLSPTIYYFILNTLKHFRHWLLKKALR